MVDFRKLTPPAALILGRRDRDDLRRIYGLADRWLGRELLRLGREARTVRGDRPGDPRSYTAALLFRAIPHLAKRLDPSAALLPEEEYGPTEVWDKSTFLPRLGPWDARRLVLNTVSNAQLDYGLPYGDARRENRAIRMLGRDPCVGNPVLIALDRAVPEPPGERPGWADRFGPSWVPAPEGEPLGGFHVLAHAGGRTSVIRHHETLLAARAEAEAALSSGELSRPPWASGRDGARAPITIDVRSQDDTVVLGPFPMPLEQESGPEGPF